MVEHSVKFGPVVSLVSGKSDDGRCSIAWLEPVQLLKTLISNSSRLPLLHSQTMKASAWIALLSMLLTQVSSQVGRGQEHVLPISRRRNREAKPAESGRLLVTVR